ncbi:MAG TPA: TetR/AcrR family transcriptional regulator [Ktedonobacteraceae bacterium]|nr:TetR/AcrR family transcriptional regulator [Ktedonobacteraceae bacterium]
MVYTKKIDQETLIGIARELLEREGMEAISMRRLAQELAVQASSLYHHFADKSALMRAVAEQGLRELAQVLQRARDEAGSDPRQQILALGLAYRTWALHHPRLYRVLFAGSPLDEQPSAVERAVPEPMLAAAAQLVGEEHAVAATQAAWALVHGFVMLELAGQMRRGIPAEGFLLGMQAFVQGLSNTFTATAAKKV